MLNSTSYLFLATSAMAEILPIKYEGPGSIKPQRPPDSPSYWYGSSSLLIRCLQTKNKEPDERYKKTNDETNDFKRMVDDNAFTVVNNHNYLTTESK